MKSLLDFVVESEQQLKVTDNWMKEKYDEFNKLYFSNALGSSDKVILKIKKLKPHILGCQGFEKRFYFFTSSSKLVNNEYVMLDENNKPIKDVYDKLQPHIFMNSDMKFTETEMEDTLIHEMIHLYTYKDGLAPKRAHGKEFKHMCDIIRAKAKQNGKNYHLTTKAESNNGENFSLDDEAKKKEQDKILKKQQSSINRCAMIYIKMSRVDAKGNLYRFMFLAKNSVDKMLNNIYDSQNKAPAKVWINPNAGDIYEDVCNKLGKFPFVKALKSGKYYYWNVKDYPYIQEKIEDAIERHKFIPDNEHLDESLNEDKKPYIKPESVKITIPADTDLSELNLEDILKIFKKDMEGDNKVIQKMRVSD